MPKSISQAQKKFVAKRAAFCCEYCHSQAEFSPDPFSVEHIIPRSKGGKSELDNLAYSCQGCNNRKYNHTEAIDTITDKVASLFHPRKNDWGEHFQWSNDKQTLIGLSPIGRATIQRLDLNRKGVVNLRMVLTPIGKHPLLQKEEE